MMIDCLCSCGTGRFIESTEFRHLFIAHNNSCKRLYGVAIGGWYRHFKGKYARVINIAMHSETGELLVVYECMNPSEDSHDGGIYARPIEMFLSEVDKHKYPDSLQKNRFELITDNDEVYEK